MGGEEGFGWDFEEEEALDAGALDAQERRMFVAFVEGHYAEALYLEADPPSPAEYAREGAAMLEGDAAGLEADLRAACETAAFRVAVGDRSYEGYREIYGAEAHRQALARREAAREAFARYRRGETGSMAETMDLTDEIARAERPRRGSGPS